MANPDGKTFGWDPLLYLHFRQERNLPIRDLVAGLGDLPVFRALDIGCGPGNSTGFLVDRWPEAEVVGVDHSPDMLSQARQSLPQVRWLQRDAGADMSDLGRFDLVFSNAALQWIPRHETVIPHLFSLVNPGGALAAQVPNGADGAMHQAIAVTVASPRWQDSFPGGSGRFTIRRNATTAFSAGWTATSPCGRPSIITSWIRPTTLFPGFAAASSASTSMS